MDIVAEEDVGAEFQPESSCILIPQGRGPWAENEPGRWPENQAEPPQVYHLHFPQRLRRSRSNYAKRSRVLIIDRRTDALNDEAEDVLRGQSLGSEVGRVGQGALMLTSNKRHNSGLCGILHGVLRRGAPRQRRAKPSKPVRACPSGSSGRRVSRSRSRRSPETSRRRTARQKSARCISHGCQNGSNGLQVAHIGSA